MAETALSFWPLDHKFGLFSLKGPMIPLVLKRHISIAIFSTEALICNHEAELDRETLYKERTVR